MSEISRHIWDGHDYLASVIVDWLKDSNSYMYGVEVDGRLVAVANLRLVDSGNTGWMEGLRVHPDFRGRGFAHVLTRQLIEKAEELGVVRLRHTTSSDNEASLKLAQEYGFVRAFEMNVFWRPTPQALPPAASHQAINASSSNDAYTLLQTNPHLPTECWSMIGRL